MFRANPNIQISIEAPHIAQEQEALMQQFQCTKHLNSCKLA
jgi:hypothetical protein